MTEGRPESMGDRGDALPPSERSSDLDLVEFFRDGKDAEARLAALAAPEDAEGRPIDLSPDEIRAWEAEARALQPILDRGRLAWQILFLRYRSTVRAVGLSRGLRPGDHGGSENADGLQAAPSKAGGPIGRDDSSEDGGSSQPPVCERARSISLEEFEDEFFKRFWDQHKARTWRGEASFKSWMRRAAGTIHVDLIREHERLSDGDMKAFEESALARAGGRRHPVGADTEEHPDGVDGDEPVEPDQEIPDRDVDVLDGREQEDAAISNKELSPKVRWLIEVTSAMPPARRLVYRLSHGLSLDDGDLRRIGELSRMDRAHVEVEVQRLYDEFQDRSDATLTRLRARRERARILSAKTQEKLRDSRRTRDQLMNAKDSTRGPQPGLDASLARAHRAMGAAIVRLRTLEGRIQKVDAALREELRIESKPVARLLSTSENNIDKHLQRAREDIARAKELV